VCLELLLLSCPAFAVPCCGFVTSLCPGPLVAWCQFPVLRHVIASCAFVCIVKVNGIVDVVFFNVFPKSDPVLARSWREDLMRPRVFQNLVR